MKKMITIILALFLLGCATTVPYKPATILGNTAERREYFVREYGEQFSTLIGNYDIAKGMTKQMVVDAWGKPEKVKYPTKGKHNGTEKWIYNKGHSELLFFEEQLFQIIENW